MGKPGIFDPWQVEPPAPEPEVDLAEVNVNHEESKTPILFGGIRYGIHVWLPGTNWKPEVGSTAARRKLVAALTKLHKLPTALGCYTLTEQPSHTHVNFTDGINFIAVPEPVKGNDKQRSQRAIDTLAICLRVLLRQHPAAVTLLHDLGVVPFVK